MKKNPRFKRIWALLITYTVITLFHIACQNHSVSDSRNGVATPSHTNTNKQTQDEKADAANTSCVDAACPKITVHAGVLNAKVLYNPKPEYPKEAKDAGIAGEVKVSVVINEKGAVACAKILTGHPLLQEAVKKVVCNVRCKPQMISGKPYNFAGILTYNFVL